MGDKNDAQLTGQLDLYRPLVSTGSVVISPADVTTLSREEALHPATTKPHSTLSSKSYYEGLDEKEIKTLENLAKQVRGQRRNHFKIVYNLGHLLARAKSKLEHGKFIEWLKQECEISIRTAQRYMSLFEFAREHVKAYKLPVCAIYECTRPGTPKDAVKELLDGVEDEVPPLAVIVAKLQRAREDCRAGAAKKAGKNRDALEQALDPAAVVAKLIVSCAPKTDRAMVGLFFRNATPDDLGKLAKIVATAMEGA